MTNTKRTHRLWLGRYNVTKDRGELRAAKCIVVEQR